MTCIGPCWAEAAAGCRETPQLRRVTMDSAGNWHGGDGALRRSGCSLLIDARSMGLSPEEASWRLFTRAQVAATPMDGWGPSGSRYLRLVFANEPAERLTDLRARFDTALS
jgi:hypothetical protein